MAQMFAEGDLAPRSPAVINVGIKCLRGVPFGVAARLSLGGREFVGSGINGLRARTSTTARDLGVEDRFEEAPPADVTRTIVPVACGLTAKL